MNERANFDKLKKDLLYHLVGVLYKVNASLAKQEIKKLSDATHEELIKMAEEYGFERDVLEKQYGIYKANAQTSNIVSFPKQAI